MPYAPRTIACHCELLRPPRQPDPAPIQRLHDRTFRSGSPPYRSFTVGPLGAALSNPTTTPGAVSSVEFLADRHRFREELTGVAVEEFAARVRSVAAEVAELERRPLFSAQVVTVRTLANPRRHGDSRSFLRDGVLRMGEELAAFGREPQVLGLRLVFPPAADAQNAFALRIETFASDPRSIFVECQGTFGGAVVERGLEPLEERVLATYAFLIERTLPFLDTFEARAEG